ncbi:MAG: phage/plasmid primase, P4 family [Reyranellaceae bacterium]
MPDASQQPPGALEIADAAWQAAMAGGERPSVVVTAARPGRQFIPVALDPRDPMPSARMLVQQAFAQAGRRTLLHHRGAFYEWNGACYRPVDGASIVAATWAFLEQARRRVAPSRPRKSSAPFEVPFQPTRGRVSDVLAALAAACNLPSDIEPPAWLTPSWSPNVEPLLGRLARPEIGDVLAVRNGLLHLPSGELHPPTPDFFGLHATDVAFEPAAPQPAEWLAFLRELWPGDAESIDTLQEWFGLCLSVDTSHQKILLLVGPKRSGKGTIARVLTRLLGIDSVAAPTLASLATNFGLAPLIGKALAIIGDARLGTRGDQAIIAERLLSISGEDAQTIDRKFLPTWTGRLTTRFSVLTNELPRLADASGALASRFIVLTLTESFFGREDHALYSRLVAELPGILNWARDGFIRLRERGCFRQPESARDAIEELEALASPVGAFIRERCFVEPGRSVECQHLFARWSEWAKANGCRAAGTAQNFGRDLRAAIPGIKVVRHRTDDGRIRIYEGITLR